MGQAQALRARWGRSRLLPNQSCSYVRGHVVCPFADVLNHHPQLGVKKALQVATNFWVSIFLDEQRR